MTNTTRTRRNFFALGAAALAGVGVAGCSTLGIGDSSSTASGPSKAPKPIKKSRTLVAYLSRPETDDPNNMTEDEANSTHVVNGKVLGNTQYVAQIIGQRTGAELFRIETAKTLPRDHAALEDLALSWQEADERPKLKSKVPNFKDYDTVFIGYPIWWYEMPMPSTPSSRRTTSRARPSFRSPRTVETASPEPSKPSPKNSPPPRCSATGSPSRATTWTTPRHRCASGSGASANELPAADGAHEFPPHTHSPGPRRPDMELRSLYGYQHTNPLSGRIQQAPRGNPPIRNWT